MRLRIIAETTDDPMTARVMDNLSHLTSSNLIDSKLGRVSWPFVYSVDLGLHLGESNSYHKDIFDAKPPKISKVLANIYRGGDQDSYYQPIPGTAKPGVSGRIGLDLIRLVTDAEKDLGTPADPDLKTKFRSLRVVTFFKDHPEWVGWALGEMLQKGVIQPDSYVVIKKQVWPVSERAGKAPPPAPPTPAKAPAPIPVSKPLTGRLPGVKWWAPTSEGKL